MWLVREQEREEELKKQREAEGLKEDDFESEEKKISIWIKLSYNNIIRGTFSILLIAIIIPICLLIYMDTSNPVFDKYHTCSYITDYKVSCGKQNTTLKKCVERKCCYNQSDGTCFHTVPSYYLYKAEKEDETSNMLIKPIMDETPFYKKNIPAYLSYKYETKDQISITLSSNPRSVKVVSDITETSYKLTIFHEQMAAVVNRTGSEQTLLSTAHGPTIISEKYWEWTVNLEAEHLFGMDFLRKADKDNTTLRRVVYKNAVDHNSKAKFMAYKSGKFHGLEIDHEGPLEVTVLPSKLILLRLLSGGYLTLRLFTGPSPQDVRMQMNNMDTKGNLLPYWALGVHMCRDGMNLDLDEILKEHKEVLISNQDIPYDTDCIHENLFSISMTLKGQILKAIDDIKKENKRFMMSLSPHVIVDESSDSPYEVAKKQNILYKFNNEPAHGSYLNSTVAYPDYASTEGKNWFKDQFSRKFSSISVDGVVVRSSWPVNDNYEITSAVQFQYFTKELHEAMRKTLPWNSNSSEEQEHINLHNSYGSEFTNTVSSSIDKLKFILSATNSPGSQIASHTQNVNTSWADFKKMITKSLSHSLLADNLISFPICGDSNQYSKEVHLAVCMRWYLTAATMPMFRISSVYPRRDPHSFQNMLYLRDLIKESIKIRYKLLPFFYTILSKNEPIIRPMFYEYYFDETIFNLEDQYMIGDSLLVVQPNLFPIPEINVYLPDVSGGWYEFWGGQKIPTNGWVTLPIVEMDLVVFIKAGKIVPLQSKIGNSAEESFLLPFDLIVAMDFNMKATGSLFVDHVNYVTVNFEINNNKLRLINATVCASSSTEHKFKISHLHIYGKETTHCIVNLELCVALNKSEEILYKDLCVID